VKFDVKAKIKMEKAPMKLAIKRLILKPNDVIRQKPQLKCVTT
jgi:hypothetical protein